MEKKFKNDLNPEQEAYIKEKLWEKYKDTFQKNGMDSISETEICNMAEFLITMHPENYAKSMETENNYRRDENLQKIYAVVDKQKNMAVLINTNEKGKIPEGEFGVYEFGNKLKADEFKTSDKIEKIIREKVEKFSNGTLTAKEEDEMVKKLMPKTLDDMDKIATKDMEIEEKTRKAIDKKIDEKNKENGKSKEDREKIEKENKENVKEQQVPNEQEEKSKNSLVSPEMLRQAYLLGYTKLKSAVVAKGEEAATKMDVPGINKNAGNVTILRLNSGKSIDKYLVFQGDRLVVPGNKDEEIDVLLGKTMKHAKDGTLIKPLEIDDEEQSLTFDGDGISIDIILKEGKEMSVEDLEEYKKKFKDNMEKYLIKLYEIENSPKKDAQKDKEYMEANEIFNSQNRDDAKMCNINFDDMEVGNLATDKRTNEQVNKENDEPDAWEVPGKRTRGE